MSCERKTFWRYGGIGQTRAINTDDAFELSVETALGDSIRHDEFLARQVWGALSNVRWFHPEYAPAAYSFRAAGDLIAAIRGEGTYIDWYCSWEAGVVSPEIETAMAKEGWTPKPRQRKTTENEYQQGFWRSGGC